MEAYLCHQRAQLLRHWSHANSNAKLGKQAMVLFTNAGGHQREENER